MIFNFKDATEKYSLNPATQDRFPFVPSPEKLTVREREGKIGPIPMPPPKFRMEKQIAPPVDKEIDLWASIKTFGEGLHYLDDAMKLSIYSGLQGFEGASVVERDRYDKEIELAKTNLDEFVKRTQEKYENKEFFPGISITDIASLPQNIAFSITSMGAGLGAALPFAGAPPVAWAVGASASGAVAFNMSSYTIMQEYLEAKDTEMKEKEGRGITLEEENELKDLFGAKAIEHGLWEAIPEVAGQVISLKALLRPLTKVVGSSSIATQILNKMTQMYGGELVTETITEMGQIEIREQAGLPGGKDIDWDSPTDWLNALKTIAPQTFLLTTIMAGAGQGVVSTKQVVDNLIKEVKEGHPSFKKFKGKINELGQQVAVEGWERGSIKLPSLPERKPTPKEIKPISKEEAAKTEYRVTYKDGDIDHINLQEAKKMATNPPTDVLMIEKVTREWLDDGTLKEEKSETFFQKLETDIDIIKGGPSIIKLGLKEKPKIITAREYTLLKEKIKAEAKGARVATVATKRNIKKLQGEVINLTKTLPLQERGKLLRTLRNVQTGEQLRKAFAQIEPKIEAIRQAQVLARTLGTMRSKLAFVRKVGEFNQTVLNEIKKEVGLTESVLKANKEQLNQIVDKLKERLKFKYKKGWRPSTQKRGTAKPEITEEMYEANHLLKEDKKRAFLLTLKRIRERAKKSTEKALIGISTRLERIAPSLFRRIRKLEFDKSQQVKKDTDASIPFFEKVKGMEKRDFNNFDLALKNSDTEKIDEMLKKYDMESEYDAVREMLTAIYKRAQGVGFDVGYLENYFPRKIKDVKGLLEYIGGSEVGSIVREAISRKETALGRTLNVYERAALINVMIRGYRQSQIMLSKTGAMKTRVINLVDSELNQFYHNSLTALARYIEEVNTAVEGRKFFGKERPTDGLDDPFNNLEDSIGYFVSDLITKGKITAEQELELKSILMAYFNPGRISDSIGFYKNLTYIAILGSPVNAITQIGDLAWSLYEGGVGKTAKALPKAITQTTDISKKSLGVERIAEEFVDKSTTGRAVDWVLRKVGLRKIDQVGKDTLIQSVIWRYQELAKNPTPKFMKELKRVFGEETDQIIADLISGRITENVKYLAFNTLLDFHPVALSEMPEQYLASNNGRIFYMLRTYTIKMFDVYRNKVFDTMKENKAEGMKELLRLTFFLVTVNATADEIKNFLLGRETKFSDIVIDNILKLIGFSRYTIDQIGREGLGSTIIQAVTPPLTVIDDIWKDLTTLFKDSDESIKVNKLRSIKNIPGGGKLYYWWLGKGLDYKEKYEGTGKREIWKFGETKAGTKSGRKKWKF